ncbi:MAG: DUF6435 family protein [Pseudomonadota bacterium]
MFGIFRRDPIAKLQKELDKKVEAAFQAQRNGNIRGYSLLTAEAEAIREDIEKARAASS